MKDKDVLVSLEPLVQAPNENLTTCTSSSSSWNVFLGFLTLLKSKMRFLKASQYLCSKSILVIEMLSKGGKIKQIRGGFILHIRVSPVSKSKGALRGSGFLVCLGFLFF